MSTHDEDQKPEVSQTFNNSTVGDVAGGSITKIGQINNSTGVAIGPHSSASVTQTVSHHSPPPPSSEHAALQAEIAALKAQVEALLSQAQQAEARQHLETLENELSKPDKPNESIVKQSIEWLLENAPTVGDTLTRMFENPAVQTLVTRAGAMLVLWINHQFHLQIPVP